jgi:hypothetical protein
MSKVRCSSIKGLGVPTNGPEINLNKFSHGQPLDLGGSNITTGTLTISNVKITTCNSTTLNVATFNGVNQGTITFPTAGDAVMKIPNGTNANRPASPKTGSLRISTTDVAVQLYDGTGWVNLG